MAAGDERLVHLVSERIGGTEKEGPRSAANGTKEEPAEDRVLGEMSELPEREIPGAQARAEVRDGREGEDERAPQDDGPPRRETGRDHAEERSPREGYGGKRRASMTEVEVPSRTAMAPAANHEWDLPLGELIVRAGLVAPNDLIAALATARAAGRRLGEVLVEQELVSERDLARLVADQEGLEFVDLGKLDLDQTAVDLLPETTARRYHAVPLRFDGHSVIVAVADPTDNEGLDAIVGEIPGGVRFVVATTGEVDAALAEAFGEALPEA